MILPKMNSFSNETEEEIIGESNLKEIIQCGRFTINTGNIPIRILGCIVAYLNIYYRIYFLPLLILSGIIGNLIAIKIFLTRSEWRATCRMYYLTMSVADFCYLVCFGIPEWTGEGLMLACSRKFTFSPENYSLFICKLFRFI